MKQGKSIYLMLTHKPFKVSLTLCFVFLGFSSCISFDLSMLKDKPAKGVVFKAPPKPYKKQEQQGMDVFWKDPKTGNMLGFFSSCSLVSPFTSLKDFQKEILGDLKNFQIIYNKRSYHQNEKANYLKLESLKSKGSTTTIMELFLFKKKKCFYVLSFLTKNGQKNIATLEKVFKDFRKEFYAP